MSINKNLKVLDNIKIAHRGLCDKSCPENSLSAYRKCIKSGIPIELDVHILKDNTLVVFHDDDTKRLTGEKIILKEAVYEDIKNLKLLNTNEKIPIFEEVLQLVDGRVLLDIELKVEVSDFRICREICKFLDSYKGQFIVKSFNPVYVWWFKKYIPSCIRGLLVSRLKKARMNIIIKKALYNMVFNFVVKPDFVAFDYRDFPNKKIDKLYQQGVLVLFFIVLKNQSIKYEYTGLIYEGK